MINFDNNATTPVAEPVLDELIRATREFYGNTSSGHSLGLKAGKYLMECRQRVAKILNAEHPEEVVFTSGGTESDNAAIRGIACAMKANGRTGLVTCAIEHRAVLNPCEALKPEGFTLDVLPVDANGVVSLEAARKAIHNKTALVSVMLANNEIGALAPLREIGALCRERGVPLHTDATQAVGRVPVNIDDLNVDLMSFSAHKLYGPKGVGALYVRRRNPTIRLEPLVEGGGQERGMRSGTLNTPGIVGFAKAVELCQAEMSQETARLQTLRQRLFDGLTAHVADVTLNGPALADPAWRLPGNLNCSFAYVDGEALMMSMRDLAVSSGSACTSTNPEPSHVLRALGLNDDLTRASLRFGLGRFNTVEDVDFAIDLLADTVRRLRRLSSLANP